MFVILPVYSEVDAVPVLNQLIGPFCSLRSAACIAEENVDIDRLLPVKFTWKIEIL